MSENVNKGLIWIPALLILYNFAANLANDIYLPSLPILIKVFHTSANAVQFTMTIWFAGVALPQLFFGPLTDRFGRRPILFWGGICFVVSTMVCGLANSIQTLMIARFFQGVGVCSLNVTCFSILVDLYNYKERVHIMNKISMCGTVAPLIGPIIGGYILIALGWRENFYFVFVLGVVSLLGLRLTLPETNLMLNPKATKIRNVASNYFKLMQTDGFLSNLIPYCLSLAGLVVYLTAAPFIIINKFHISPEKFGFTQLPIFIIFILGSLILGRIQEPLQLKKILKLGIKIVLGSGLCMFFASLIFGSHLFILLFFMMLYALGFSFCASTLVVEVMDVGTDIKGSAAAFLGFGMAISCVIANAVLSLVYNGTILSVAGIIATIAILSQIIFMYRKKINILATPDV